MLRSSGKSYSAFVIVIAAVLHAAAVPADIRSTVPVDFLDLVPNAETPSDTPGMLADGAAYVELFIDGNYAGDVTLSYENGALKFFDPQAVSNLVPRLRRAEDFLKRLQAPSAACIRFTDERCPGRPGNLSIVYEPRIPRLSIDRPTRFVTPQAPVVPSDPEAAGLLSSFAWRMSGRHATRTARQRGSLTINLVAGRGTSNVFANGVLSSSGRYFSRNAGFARFAGRYRLGVGLLQAEASEHFSQIDLLGLEWGTAERTLQTDRNSNATPLMLFLDEDSQVEVVRDGELLLSRFFRSGTIRLPTHSFPAGSYDLLITIRGVSGTVWEERRFFFRSNSSQPPGRLSFTFQAGYTRDASASASRFEINQLPFAALRVTRPAMNGLVLGGRLGMLDDMCFAELSGERSYNRVRMRLSGLATSNGGASLAALAGGRFSGVNFSSSFRHSRLPSLASAFRYRSQRFTEANVTASTELPAGMGTISANMRARRAQSTPLQEAWGLNWSRPFRSPGRFGRGRVGLAYQKSPSGHRLQLQLQFGVRGQRTSLNSQLTHFNRRAPGGDDSSYTNGSIQGGWWSHQDAQVPWNLTSRLSQDSDSRRQLSLSGRRRHDSFDVEAQIRHEQSDTSSFAYSGSLYSTLALTTTGLTWSAQRAVEGGLLMDTRDTPEDVEIIAKIDGRQLPLKSRTLNFTPLTAFKQHDVAFRPIGRSSIGYDNSRISMLPFPGNLVVLRPELFRTVTVFGRLVDGTGQPIQGRISLPESDPYVTETDGYFIMDLPVRSTGQSAEVDLGNAICLFAVPELSDNQETYVDLSDVTCVPAAS